MKSIKVSRYIEEVLIGLDDRNIENVSFALTLDDIGRVDSTGANTIEFVVGRRVVESSKQEIDKLEHEVEPKVDSQKKSRKESK